MTHIRTSSSNNKNHMTTDQTKKEFIPVKKLSPFVADPYNTRGRKGGKKGGAAVSGGSSKGGKNISMPKFKGGAGGDR